MLSANEFIQLIEKNSLTYQENLRFLLSDDILSNAIIFPINTVPNLDQWENLAEYISTTNKKYVIINWLTEGPIPYVLIFSSFLMERLIENYGFDKDQFMITLGTPDVPMTHYWYNKYSEYHSYLPKPVYNSFWEITTRNDALPREPNHNVSYEKRVLSFNRQPRLNRLAMISEVVERGLWDKFILSFMCEPKLLGKFECAENRFVLPNLIDKIHNNINSIKHLLPIELNIIMHLRENILDNMCTISSEGLEMYENTLVSLVGECSFQNNLELIDQYDNLKLNCYFYPCFYPTEKIWKAIKCKHPFIVAAPPYFLQGLREMGYKTFDPYIDETYDTIENEEERILAIMDQAEKIANMNDEEVKKWLNSIQEITQYNYERFMNSAG